MFSGFQQVRDLIQNGRQLKCEEREMSDAGGGGTHCLHCLPSKLRALVKTDPGGWQGAAAGATLGDPVTCGPAGRCKQDGHGRRTTSHLPAAASAQQTAPLARLRAQ